MPTDRFSRGGYRWVMVAAASVILAVAMGQLVNGLSVYFVPLETAFGWERGRIASINTAGLIGLAGGGILMGRVADRIGVRPVAIFGVAVFGLTVLAASRATALWQLQTLYFFSGMLGGGAIFVPLMALVGGWFTRRAGLAIGIASAGQALGQGGMPFAGTFLIEALGWRGAMTAQGVGALALLLPLALLLRDPPRPAGGPATLPEESPTDLPNWVVTLWLSAAVLFCCTCMAVPLMHLVPLIQGRGFAAPEGGGVLFAMLMVAILGRIAFGRLADAIGAVPAYLTASAWQTVLVFGFTFIGRIETFYVYASVYGFGYAGVMTTLLVTARNLTAPARRAASMGVILALAYLGHGLGGWQGGWFYDLTGGYGWSYANAAIAGLVNLAIVGALWLAIKRRPRTAAI